MSNFSGTADDNGRKFHKFDGHKKIFKKAAKEAVHALKTIKIRNMPQAFAKEMKADRNVPPVSAMIKDLKEMKETAETTGRKEKESAPSRLICWKSAIWTAALSN